MSIRHEIAHSQANHLTLRGIQTAFFLYGPEADGVSGLWRALHIARSFVFQALVDFFEHASKLYGHLAGLETRVVGRRAENFNLSSNAFSGFGQLFAAGLVVVWHRDSKLRSDANATPNNGAAPQI